MHAAIPAAQKKLIIAVCLVVGLAQFSIEVAHGYVSVIV